MKRQDSMKIKAGDVCPRCDITMQRWVHGPTRTPPQDRGEQSDESLNPKCQVMPKQFYRRAL
jgi:hypothetical protein